MTQATAYQTPGAKAPFEKTTIERRELQPTDVRIKIAYAGICHSDIHTAREEWGEAMFPLVPGHEIAGVIEEVGSDVKNFKVGDHAGVGCFVDSCRECENCKNNEEQFCTNGGMTGTYNAVDRVEGKPTAGGYSTEIVVDEAYTLHIPDNLGLDEAAPLLCAGITLYSPLHQWGAGPGKKVGIVGMGGLGHMGVKIASAMGADVHVLSQTDHKADDSKKFGAKSHHATKDGKVFEDEAGTYDLIVNTVAAQLPIGDYLGLLKTHGTLVNVGAPADNLEINAFGLLSGAKTWAGSMIGGIKETQEMLDFCGENNIGATVEVINADQIDEAYDNTVDSKVRYRYVIDIDSMR